ncbi:MAG: T9SS type A sorting domain-containing protein, partial [Bacteroidales bacterium]|nr:T9SS type A sorting domain-containing protein [Bacteroidales bacterium]
GTDATNVILKLDLDNQTLLGSIEADIPEIRHCSFNRQDGSLLAGDWNSLYRIDTTSGTSQQIRSDLANVYSSAFDNLSAGGPYLWLFSQTSQDNGPSACIRQFDISANDFTDKIHYLDDIEISDASLAGGICASEYVCEGKFVLLANVQNPSGSNTIATYEIGRTNSVARAERKSGSIAPSESESIPVRASATETGEYASTIRYRAAVMGRQSNDVIVNISAIAPECDAVQRITATTDNSTITLEWSPVELGEYESVSYLVYNTSSQYAIDTLSDTSVTYRGLPLGEHCFYVRALSSAGYTCLSEASDTVCAEIKDSPCDIPLFVEARSDGETITVSWNTHADVDHFNIYKDGESIAENLTTTTFVDTDVVPETDYCYTVVAHLNNALCDEISETTCMRILTGVCTEAPVLTADAIGNSVILKWTECEGAVNYRIFRDDEFVGTTTDISYTDNVHEAGNYCYVVESDCEHRMYKLSNEECVFADAIAELSADDITLYPNPTYGQFFIEGQHIAVVQIFNATGQLVTEIENTEAERITVNCDGWNPGIYNVRIISAKGELATRKVTIFR